MEKEESFKKVDNNYLSVFIEYNRSRSNLIFKKSLPFFKLIDDFKEDKSFSVIDKKDLRFLRSKYNLFVEAINKSAAETKEHNEGKKRITNTLQNVEFYIENYYEKDFAEIKYIINSTKINYLLNYVPENKISEIDELFSYLKAKKIKADEITDRLIEYENSDAIGKHSKVFKSQEGEHKTNVNTWYKRIKKSIIATLLALVILLVLLIYIPESKLIRVAIIGAMIISILTYTTVLFVKNYFAEKHNETVNRHRANCLATFDTFIDNADPDKKGAILLQATNTIFAHQRSGYLSKETETTNPSPVIEIVKNINKNS